MYSILTGGINLYFPNKTVKIHQNDKPWITPQIKSLIKRRQIAFAANSNQWPKLRNMVKRAIEKAKVMYYAEKVRKLQTEEPRKWYQSLKVMLNTNNSELKMHIRDTDENDHKAMANAINTKFVNVSSHVQPLDPSALPAFLPANGCVPVLNPWEVYHELNKVKVSKSSGPDGIPPKIIREFAYELSGPMTEILNSSFAEGIVPHQWKSAIVIPVPKQYPPSIDKLRPISLTDIFAKVAEGFISKWILDDIAHNIDINQFGNISGISTSHYLINLVHTMFQGSDPLQNVGTVVLTDFSKAFDLVNHNIAIDKLLALGVRGAIVPWVINFLSDRQQCVRYNQTLSDYAQLHAGVPQGTKIGPIAFQAVINDAAQGCSSHYWKYVDDLTFAENRNCNESSSLQTDLDGFLDWSLRNQLKLNPDKCQAINICFMKDPPPRMDLKIGNTSLNYVHHAKVLGIFIQEDLKWDTQVDYVCKNANRRLFILGKLKRFGFNTNELITIYSYYVRPVLENADVIWHSALTEKQSLQIERVQKRACKIILGYNKYNSYQHALSKCDLEPLSTRRENHCLKFAQSLPSCDRTSGLLPLRRKEVHGRSLRNDSEYSRLPVRTSRFGNSPVPYYIKLLNK